MSQIPPPEPFNCEGNAASVGLRWETWKLSLEIFLLALNITDPVQKKATLLHIGGIALQYIYHNIPDSEEVYEDNDVYQSLIKKFDDHFSPRRSIIYERYLFRALKQRSGEEFDKFLFRLQRQSSKCKFPNEEDNLIDQILEKCSSKDLKKKILTLGDDVTLDNVIYQANAIESLERQLTSYGQRQWPEICSRCGMKDHNAYCYTCPAKSQTCHKCGMVGHYRRLCNTGIPKRKYPDRDSKYSWKKPKEENDDNQSSCSSSDISGKHKTNIEYIFNIDNDATLICNLGGVDVETIIDSGSKNNILSEKTWNRLKECKIVVWNQIATRDKTFVAYSNQPLKVIGSFDVEIRVGSNVQIGKFYVIKNGTRDLLGKDTAICLEVLKLGIAVNALKIDKSD